MNKKAEQLLPFVSEKQYKIQMGQILLMLHEALKLIPDTWTQSPRWCADPTPEMIKNEKEYLETAAENRTKVNELAADIHVALTGRNPEEILNILQELYEDCCESDAYPTSDEHPLYKARKILQANNRIENEEEND